VNSALKTPFIVVGVPVATWLGISAYWSLVRSTGEAPTYYVASMAGLRALLVGPVQLVTMIVLALALRAVLAKTSWVVLAAACVAATGLAVTGDAIGMHYSRVSRSRLRMPSGTWLRTSWGRQSYSSFSAPYHGRPTTRSGRLASKRAIAAKDVGQPRR
jgi:hypothetical protein